MRITLGATLGTTLLGAGLLVWVYSEFASDLPSNLDAVTDYTPLRASQVLSAEGEIIGEFFVEKRQIVPYAEIPERVRRAFVAAEDQRFYQHGGIDYQGILRAAWANFRAGHVVQGGSSITQQVAKLLIVGKERSLARKIREAMLAHRIEKHLDKDAILGIYLNHVYLGHGAYGVGAAASAYFGKSIADLSVAEAAMLAGLPKAPGSATPVRDFDRAQARQRYVLSQMQELGYLDPKQAAAARAEALVLVPQRRALRNVAAPYFVETVRRHVGERYGDEELLQRGLRIHTTLDMRMQRAAEAALRAGLEELERRLGFSGPIEHLAPEAQKRLTEGAPRPFGPAGFSLEDAEQEGLLVPVGELKSATVDATQPGALLPVTTGRTLARENAAAARRRTPLPEVPNFDPDTTYAAVVLSLASTGVTLGSGSLRAHLVDDDVRRVLQWKDVGGRNLRPGDVLPVLLSFDERDNRPARARRVPAPPRVLARLATQPSVQGALVALDPRDGHLLAMVGGYDYQKSQFNRVTQAHRQVGSAIKPFIYAAAMDRGMTPLTIRWDVPVKFRTVSGVWAPRNYRPEYLGAITLRTALAKSINTVAAQLVAQMGVSSLIGLLRNAGVKSNLPHALSISLGTPDLTLHELSYALASFPAGGARVAPLSIVRVLDADGTSLEQHAPPAAEARPRVVAAETAYIVTHLMQAVVESGTARRARELGRPVAGKTGTSNGFRDAWFVGFTPDLVCGVWIGRDDFKPIGHDVTGGQAALPIWMDFMREALRDRPVRDFEPPPGTFFVRANPDTGLPAMPTDPKSRLIPLKRGTLPPAFKGPAHGGTFGDQAF